MQPPFLNRPFYAIFTPPVVRRGWDLVPYMATAELHLKQCGRMVGEVFYKHGRGFDLSKYYGTASKMDPVIDELLARIREGFGGIRKPNGLFD